MDLSEVAAELYTSPPDQFVAARDAHAAEARKAGDRPLAAEIKRLRRPTVGAALVNLLVRERAADVDQLLTLGGALRDAQSQLDAAELRRLSQQRHELVSTLITEAVAIGREHGLTPSDGARREAEETLEAALADPAAADAVRSGRLTVALQYSGFGSVDVTDAVAVPRIAPPPSRPRAAKTAEKTTEEPDGERRRRERREAAEQELREAEAAADAAQRDVDERARAAADATQARDHVAEEIADLERRLHELRSQHDDAAGAARAADGDRADAEQAADAARDRARRARAALDRLDT